MAGTPPREITISPDLRYMKEKTRSSFVTFTRPCHQELGRGCAWELCGKRERNPESNREESGAAVPWQRRAWPSSQGAKRYQSRLDPEAPGARRNAAVDLEGWLTTDNEAMNDDAIRARLIELLQIGDAHAGTHHPLSQADLTRDQGLVLALFANCRSLLRGITFLLREEHGHEATILMRTLLQDATTVFYVFKKQPTTSEMTVRFDTGRCDRSTSSFSKRWSTPLRPRSRWPSPKWMHNWSRRGKEREKRISSCESFLRCNNSSHKSDCLRVTSSSATPATQCTPPVWHFGAG